MTSARPDSTETGSAEPDSPDPAGRLLSRAFAIWLGAATLAAVGDGILYFAVGWTASGLGAHTAGIVLTLGLLPRTVLLLIGGATGDRWGLRRTMIGCDAFMCVVLVAFLAAEHTPVPTIGLLAGLELVTGIASSFRMPAAGAYPRLFVDEARLPRAMSLTGSMLEVARLVGPPLGGVLVGLLAMTGAVTATLAGVVLILVVLVTVRPPYEQPPEPDESSALHRIKEGLLAARRVSGVMPLLGAVGLLAAGVIPMLSLCVPLAARERDWSASVTGVIEAVWIVGTLSISLLVARLGTRKRPVGALVAGPALASVGVLVVAVSPDPIEAMAGALVMGFGTAIFTTHVFPLFVLQTPDGMLARFQALLGLVQVAPMLLANNVLGAVAQHGHATQSMLLVAALSLVAALVIAASPTLRAVRFTPGGPS